MTDSQALDAAEAPAVLLTTAQLQQLIPHRWPFLLVDRIVEEDRRARLHPRREGGHGW